MMKNKKRILYGILTCLWCYVIYSFSNSTGEASGSLSLKITQQFIDLFYPAFYELEVLTQQSILDFLHLLIRKLAHMTEYAILYGLAFQFINTYSLAKIKKYIYPLIFSSGYALLDEFHQLFIDGRAGSIVDVGIDSLGALCMMAIIFMVEKWIHQHSKVQ